MHFKGLLTLRSILVGFLPKKGSFEERSRGRFKMGWVTCMEGSCNLRKLDFTFMHTLSPCTLAQCRNYPKKLSHYT